MDADTINIRPRPADMSEALPHAATRVRLAKAEQSEAVLALMRARDAVRLAEEHKARCDKAAIEAVRRLSLLAETGRCDAYCPTHDLYYTFEPRVPKKDDGTVDHYTNYDERWMQGGVPPCPSCVDKPIEADRRVDLSRDATKMNWML